MRLISALFLLAPTLALGQDISGRWIITTDFYLTPMYLEIEFKQSAHAIAGNFLGDDLQGTLEKKQLHVIARSAERGEEDLTAAISGDYMSGTLLVSSNGAPRESHHFSAVRAVTRRPTSPTRHEFKPVKFYREFSAATPPVLHVAAGDTVHTTTVDATGQDETGKERVWGGNPQTGPFYVDSAQPGDVLVVHLNRLTLNRDYAISDDAIVPRALDPELALKAKDLGRSVRWILDREHGVARLDAPASHLKNFTVQVRPMLGCVAVAAAADHAAPSTGDSGNFGGNMDFNEVVEGATVYLQVMVPGALLYLGDGHAAQGDGELTGNALETSMDVEFTVDIISNRSIGGPRVESSTQIMTVGMAGSLDEALRAATSDMAQWLEQAYGLAASETSLVFGSAAQYKVSEIADRNVGVVMKLGKAQLASLKQSADLH